MALALSALGCGAAAAADPVDLGAAAGFGVLANTAITNTGFTTVTGDIGTTSGTAVTGIGAVTVTGVNHNGDAATVAAHASLLDAMNYAEGLASDFVYPNVQELGGMTLDPGVHFNAESFGVTGILTLDAGGDSTAVWVFQMGTTLTTGTGSSILLENGAQAGNVFWQVGSSATLGPTSSFAGSILAFQSITLNTGAVIDGRALAYTGAVTMNTNTVTVPEVSSSVLGALAVLGMAALRRRR
ncbi:MAG: ice-binding family protein [Verrucomicrobiota bacterium]